MAARRGLVVAMTVTAVVALVGAVRAEGFGAPAGSWERLPDPPVRPRAGAVAASVDGRAVFLGGEIGPPCPPNASCVAAPERARDGAVYDPVTRTWRRTAPAPADLEPYGTPAVLGGTVWALSPSALLGYDVAGDRWTSHPLPPAGAPGEVSSPQVVAHDGRLVVAWGEYRDPADRDRVLDPRTGTWSSLPPDPLTPSTGRMLTSTPAGLVLTAHRWEENPGADGPWVLRAAVLTSGAGSWRLLPDSDQLGGGRWAWTGRRLVDPSLGGADGGQVGNYGRVVPDGGLLDPVTGRWSRLPSPPGELSGGWPVEALEGPLVAAGGWLYDDAGPGWTRLPRPDDAPRQPGSAVWAGGTLVVLGGLDPDAGATTGAYSRHAWAYRP